MSVHVNADTSALIEKIAEFLLAYLDSVKIQTNVTIGVSGGSMPTYVCNVLKQLEEEDKRRIRLFPVDERLVRANDPDNNMSAYVKELTDHGYDESSFVCVDETTIDNAELAAEKFTERLKVLKTKTTADGFPIFDILFLGLGPDGHTCSLFPKHPLLQEKTKPIAAIEDSPKPPPRRITITLPVINSARKVVFLVTGESKAQIVKEIIEDRNPAYPPSLIHRPTTSSVQWFLDYPAALKLSQK